MKNVLFVLLLFAFSCTNQAQDPDAEAQPAEQISQEAREQMRRFEIDPADKACTQDSDCTMIQTQCACSCGESLNKNAVGKYEGRREEICQGYSGPTCKMACNIETKCESNVCTFVNRI